MNELLWQKRIRNWAGILGGALPFLSFVSAWIYGRITGGLPCQFWQELSISATYYVSPALAGILTAASLVLMCYDGYDKQDSIVTTITGFFGLMIVLFPCKCPISPDFVGFFQLTENVSDIIHCVSAVLFFLLLAYNSLFLFTKTDKTKERTARKKIRDVIYRLSGIGMICALSLIIVPISFPAKNWWIETVALLFFSVSWLTKGEAFVFLNDKQ
jgi:hypothetical protein